MIDITEYNRPLSGSEKRDVKFVDFVSLRIKVNGVWIPAIFKKGIHIRRRGL